MSGINRRRFLKQSGAWTLAAAAPRLLFARSGTEARLVVVILRGALDGLAAAPPYGDPNYATLRGELAISAPGTADGALRLDSTFGLHPALAFVNERFEAKEALLLHATASPYRERSHFDGQAMLENGLARPNGAADGWLNRALAEVPRSTSRERAIAISQNVPLILRGAVAVVSKSPQALPEADEDLLARLADLYSEEPWFAARLAEGMQTDAVGAGGMAGSGGRNLSAAASMAGAMMRAEGGPQIAVLEASGWDTHANQGGAHGLLAQRLGGLDQALRDLKTALDTLWPQTAVLVITEFGRTAAVNGTRGTDHGTAGCALLLGGAVNGGRVIADWPGLTNAALLERRDVKPTLDLRSIMKGVLADHVRVDSRSLEQRVFPDSTGARALTDLIRA